MMTLEELAGIDIIRNDDSVDVSVWCSTYNHAEYIEKALEGFIMQKTSFNYEVVIYDDASTDETSEVIKKYVNKYPNLIIPYIAKNNTYNHKDLRTLSNEFKLKVLRGKYIAFCEGDDYWIDEYKLQTQYDYMQAHKNCVMVMHNSIWQNCATGECHDADTFETVSNRQISDEEAIMIYRSHPATASFFFKKELLVRPDFFFEAPMGDYPLMLYAMTQGEVHYMPRVMSVYRFMSNNSVSASLKSDIYRAIYFNYNTLVFLMKYNEYSNYKYHKWIQIREQQYMYLLFDRIHSIGGVRYSLNLCTQKGYNICESEQLLQKLEEIYELIYGDNLNHLVIDYIKGHKKVFIMGAGKYASIISKKIKENNLDFDSYVVSDSKGMKEHMGKKIRDISDFDNKAGDGLIIAIRPTEWNDISLTLERHNIGNYYCPFLLDIK